MSGFQDIMSGTFPAGQNPKYFFFKRGIGVEEVGEGFLLALFSRNYL